MDHGGDVWLAEGTPIILKHYLDDESFFRRFYLVDPQGQVALQGSYTEFIPLNSNLSRSGSPHTSWKGGSGLLIPRSGLPYPDVTQGRRFYKRVTHVDIGRDGALAFKGILFHHGAHFLAPVGSVILVKLKLPSALPWHLYRLIPNGRSSASPHVHSPCSTSNSKWTSSSGNSKKPDSCVCWKIPSKVPRRR